jgi:hypothetical protein
MSLSGHYLANFLEMRANLSVVSVIFMEYGWTVSTDFVAAPQYQIAQKSIQQYWSCPDKETDGTSECYALRNFRQS